MVSIGRQTAAGVLPQATGQELPPEVLQFLQRALMGGGGAPSGPAVGGASPSPADVARARLPTITPGGGGIGALIERFLGGSNSPIGQVMNPGQSPGFGIAGPGGRGLPPSNPGGAISGGGPPGMPTPPGQVVRPLIPPAGPAGGLNPLIAAIMRAYAGSGLGSNAMAVGSRGGGNPPAGPEAPYIGKNVPPVEGQSGRMIADTIAAMGMGGRAGAGAPVTAGLVDPRRAGAPVPLPNPRYSGQRIRPGQTLSGIAGGNINRQRMIQAANPSIRDPNKIRAGATINVPVTNVTRSKASTGVKKASTGAKKAAPVTQKKKAAKANPIKQNAYKAAKQQTADQVSRRNALISGGRR